LIGVIEGHALFVKLYPKNIKDKDKEELIFESMEVDGQGEVSNAKSLFFEPASPLGDRLYVIPTIFLNTKDNSITLVGYMKINNKNVNGLYLMKYDYLTSSQTYKKEHHFKDILKKELRPGFRTHYEIPEIVNQQYSLTIRKEDVIIDSQNGLLEVRIITDYDLNNTRFFEVKFDKYGDHVQTGAVEFLGNIKFFGNALPTPLRHELLWKDNTRPHFINSKPGMWDYINSKAGNKKAEIFWMTQANSSQNHVIRFDQKEGIFSLITLK
jgi:hypothetical protein